MKDVFALMIRLEKLKRTARTGWNMEFPPDHRFKTRKIEGAESVADHSWSLAMFALVVAQGFGLDALKIVWMALVHDVAEIITLDIVTAALDPEEKVRVEAEKRAARRRRHARHLPSHGRLGTPLLRAVA